MALKFFNEIQEKQKSIDEKLQQIEDRLANFDQCKPQNISIGNEASNKLPVSTAQQSRSTDRSYNVVIYGVEECPTNTARSKLEVEKVLPVLTSIEQSISSTSISDIHRLGKYNPNGIRPRPLLIKFLRTVDANSILSNRGKVKRPFIIKADMTPEERKIESILLYERWNLIQQGTDRKLIRIRNGQIFINKTLHGKVTDFNYMVSQNNQSSVNTSQSTTTDSMDHQTSSQ